jgi:hypothetical protein
MNDRKHKRIVSLEVQEVSLVASPANLAARVTLFKSHAADGLRQLLERAEAGECLTADEIRMLTR